jgi:hypothetical protein
MRKKTDPLSRCGWSISEFVSIRRLGSPWSIWFSNSFSGPAAFVLVRA